MKAIETNEAEVDFTGNFSVSGKKRHHDQQCPIFFGYLSNSRNVSIFFTLR